MRMGTRTMRQVVEQLRGENAEAFLELVEFEYAMAEVGRNLELLATSVRELHARAAVLAREQDGPGVQTLVEAAATAADRAEQISGALAEFARGLRGWGISESG